MADRLTDEEIAEIERDARALPMIHPPRVLRIISDLKAMREAIRKHRDTVWGAKAVQHDADTALYAALPPEDSP